MAATLLLIIIFAVLTMSAQSAAPLRERQHVTWRYYVKTLFQYMPIRSSPPTLMLPRQNAISHITDMLPDYLSALMPDAPYAICHGVWFEATRRRRAANEPLPLSRYVHAFVCWRLMPLSPTMPFTRRGERHTPR